MCLSFSHECIPTTFMKQQLMASFTLGHLDGLTQCHSLDCCPPVTALWSLCYPPPPVHNTMLFINNNIKHFTRKTGENVHLQKRRFNLLFIFTL